MSAPPRYADSELLAVLENVNGLHRAAVALGMDRHSIRKRCYRSATLMRAYLECRNRGHAGATVLPGQTPKTCALCHLPGHNRQNCLKRERQHAGREGAFCGVCYGLSHRRPRGIRVVCACGELWAPEPEITLDDMFEQPRENWRTY